VPTVNAQTSPVGWRNDGTGIFTNTTPPTKWSAKRGNNVQWKTELPSWGNASPVVFDSKVFVTSEPTDLVAIDGKTGDILWTRSHDYIETLEGDARTKAIQAIAGLPELRTRHANAQRELNRLRRGLRRARANPDIRAKFEKQAEETEVLREELDTLLQQYHVVEAESVGSAYASGFVGLASSTPVIYQGKIYSLFGNGVASCHDLDGNRLWMTWVGNPASQMKEYHSGHAASPILVDGVLVVGLGQTLGLDALTGRVLWRKDDYPYFGTPAAGRVGTTAIVVTPVGNVHRVSDGEQLGSSLREVWYTGPLLVGNTVYFIGNTAQSIAADAFDLSELSKEGGTANKIWSQKRPNGRHYTTAIPLKNRLVGVTRLGKLFAIQASDGATNHSQQIGFKDNLQVFSSPVWAGDHLYITAEDGTTHVLKPQGNGYEKVASNDLEEIRSSFFVIGDIIYARGLKHLYCISAKAP